MYWKGNTSRGILSFSLDGTVLGNNLDQYSTNQTYPIQDYGTVTFTNTGEHTIVLTAVGKNPASSAYWLSASEFLFTLVQPPQPVINSSTSLDNGTFQLSGTGFPTLPYQIQMSTNLTGGNWITIGTNYADSTGHLNFTDTNATGTVRFYRLIIPPTAY